MRWLKWITLVLTVAVFIGALCLGIGRFGLPENGNTVKVLDGPWKYTADSGQSGSFFLPEVISLPMGTGEIRLTTMLPEWTGEAYAIHFTSMEQSVEVLIDGERRYGFGTSADSQDFVYRSGHHINQAVLKQEDSGKELTIVYRSSPLFIIEMGLLREVQLGTVNDLTLCRFRDSVPYFFISLFSVLLTFSAFIILTTYRGMSLRCNFLMFVLALAASVFFNLENPAIWSMLHHSQNLSSLMDWVFYYTDPLIPFLVWFTMYESGWEFRGYRRKIPVVLGICYVFTAVLSLTGFFNFNLMRPVFMVLGFIFTFLLVSDRRKQGEGGRPPGLSLASLVFLSGYYLDYLKYCLMILPVSAKWSVFLQIKLDFQFFTGISLFLFPFFVLRETMKQLANRESDIKVENATVTLWAEYARQQYESILQRDMTLRHLRHDMRFHFRTAATLLADGQPDKAKKYLTDLGETVEDMHYSKWCEDYIANITIGWYADRFSSQNIPFSADACVPHLKEEVHAEISCILSNALQNALEGCDGQEEPFVRLSAKPKGNELLIRIENRCSRELILDNDRIATTKTEKGHGLGITSMQAAVRRRNGYLKVTAGDGIFRVDAVLCAVFAEG